MKTLINAFVLLLLIFGFTRALFAAEQAAEPKEWTLLVFLNGDNNLDDYGTSDMEEMKKVGSGDHFNVLVLRDVADQKVPTKLYYMEKGKASLIYQHPKNIDMGDWRMLVDFFKFATEKYPAKHYLVDIWNHGAGWKLKRGEDPATRGISYDDGSGNHITTPQLGEAFRAMQTLNGGKKIDILGMDACLMQMAEVGYEVKNNVSVVIGSEETEPGDGWAYDGFLNLLANKPFMSAEELGIAIESEYAKSYNGGSQGRKSVQGSVVSTEKLEAAKDKIAEFSKYAVSILPGYFDKFQEAINRTQAYANTDYKDMIHFLKLAIDGVDDEMFKKLALETIGSIQSAVLANYVIGSGLEGSHGLSVWIPSEEIYTSKKKQYHELLWAKDSQWGFLLDNLLVPSMPLVKFTGFSFEDENNDQFLLPGERVNIKVKLKNESSVVAKKSKLTLIMPAAFILDTAEILVPNLPQGETTVPVSGRVAPGATAGAYSFKAKLEVVGVGNSNGSGTIVIDDNYVVEPHAIASTHPYPVNYDNTWVIEKPGVNGIRVHFAKIETEKNYDFVYIMDKNNKVIAKYDGTKGSFWAPLVAGDTVKIRMTSDNMINLFGFEIDKIAH